MVIYCVTVFVLYCVSQSLPSQEARGGRHWFQHLHSQFSLFQGTLQFLFSYSPDSSSASLQIRCSPTNSKPLYLSVFTHCVNLISCLLCLVPSGAPLQHGGLITSPVPKTCPSIYTLFNNSH